MPIGGADKRALEVGKNLEKTGVIVSVLTTDAGREVLEHWGWSVKAFEVARPGFWPKSLENSLLGRILAYLYVMVADVYLIFTNNQLSLTTDTIVYPTSDMFFDLLPAFFLRLRSRRVHLVGIIHHWIPNPLARGGFSFSNLLIFIVQRLSFYFLKVAADRIFVPKTLEGEKIRTVLKKIGVDKDKIIDFLNGVNLEEVGKAPETEKTYAACFLGGFRPSKGIFDLVPVWQTVQQQLPGAKLLLIGGGMLRYRQELENRIKEAGLSESIILAGVISQPELYKNVKKAKILISPSHEEGWGIAVLEALACGLPVVAYDLPAYTTYGESVVKVSLGDKEKLGQAAALILSDPAAYEKQQQAGLKVAKEFDWKEIAVKEKYELENILSSH